MTAQQQTQQACINELCFAVMIATARRIARLNMVDETEAENDYNQAIGAMTADEVRDFDKAIVIAAIQFAA